MLSQKITYERFIPAGAGNSRGGHPQQWIPPVHTRGGGELRGCDESRTADYGSSPRGRGTRSGKWLYLMTPRFIPAGAGNSLGSLADWFPVAVHPRGGGELSTLRPICHGSPGSSPRGRGTLRGAGARGGGERFIPAGAGNSAPFVSQVIAAAVHPRGGGELSASSERTCVPTGSSPRGRGTQFPPPTNRSWFRFIPAGAGNSWLMFLWSPARAVHPRGGGELWGWSAACHAAPGSSPRGRGTRSPRRWRAVC